MGAAESGAGARGQTRQGYRRRWQALLLVGATTAMLGVVSCSSDSGDDATMVLAMSFTPNPTTALPSETEAHDFVAPYQVTLTETGGLGGALSDFNIVVYESVDGEQGPLAVSSDNLLLDFESARIEPRGTLDLQLNTLYSLASGEKAAFIDVFISVVDDDGFPTQVGDRLTVQ